MRARASSSNMGSMSNRLVLTMRFLGVSRRFDALRLVASLGTSTSLLRPDLAARLLARVHGLALDAIDHRVEARLVRGAGGVAADRLSADDERDLDDLGVRGASMLLGG